MRRAPAPISGWLFGAINSVAEGRGWPGDLLRPDTALVNRRRRAWPSSGHCASALDHQGLRLHLRADNGKRRRQPAEYVAANVFMGMTEEPLCQTLFRRGLPAGNLHVMTAGLAPSPGGGDGDYSSMLEPVMHNSAPQLLIAS